jgi:bifunctional non-homologous end joining protein LigD
MRVCDPGGNAHNFIEPCLPTGSRTAPTGPQWAYEIKHDGFRFICHRDGERVRVFSRTGHEWGAQLPAIAAALRALPVRSVILDGEGVICGPDGVSDFDLMRAVFGRKGSPDVFLDVLEMDGHDLRAQSWDTRRALLTQLLDRCQEGLRLLSMSRIRTARSSSGRHVSWGLRGRRQATR